MHQQRTNCISARDDQDCLSFVLQVGFDLILPKWDDAAHAVLERLLERQLVELEVGVQRVVPGVVLRFAQQWRRVTHPLLKLGLPVFVGDIPLVEAGKSSIHALVEAPRALHRRSQEAGLLGLRVRGRPAGLHLVHHELRRARGALEEACVDLVESNVRRAKHTTRLTCLLLAQRAQRHVHPARKAVEVVPLRLAVPQEDDSAAPLFRILAGGPHAQRGWPRNTRHSQRRADGPYSRRQEREGEQHPHHGARA
mmetsp:Transcript_35238/g.87900  ORF Transcript_35238/g.87900 Transcript_35238/m.87900 type:complete len:253 (-) Transcript_35238:34-792(-)